MSTSTATPHSQECESRHLPKTNGELAVLSAAEPSPSDTPVLRTTRSETTDPRRIGEVFEQVTAASLVATSTVGVRMAVTIRVPPPERETGDVVTASQHWWWLWRGAR